jgi:hypothetical protein
MEGKKGSVERGKRSKRASQGKKQMNKRILKSEIKEGKGNEMNLCQMREVQASLLSWISDDNKPLTA